jgi:hypothetical protein
VQSSKQDNRTKQNKPTNSLELVGIGEVRQSESGGSGKGYQTDGSGKVSLDFVLSGGGVDLHLGLDGPDIGFSVLIDGDTSLGGGIIVLGKESGRPGGGGNRGC